MNEFPVAYHDASMVYYTAPQRKIHQIQRLQLVYGYVLACQSLDAAHIPLGIGAKPALIHICPISIGYVYAEFFVKSTTKPRQSSPSMERPLCTKGTRLNLSIACNILSREMVWLIDNTSIPTYSSIIL